MSIEAITDFRFLLPGASFHQWQDPAIVHTRAHWEEIGSLGLPHAAVLTILLPFCYQTLTPCGIIELDHSDIRCIVATL